MANYILLEQKDSQATSSEEEDSEVIGSFKTPLITTQRCLTKYKLLIMVTSHPENFKRRSNIRSTWGPKWLNEKDLPPWKTVFQLGQSNKTTVQEKTIAEAVKYQDMIFGDFNDTFYILPIKVIMGFEWATKFCDFDFLLKIDDDVFVNIPNTFKFLSAPYIPKTRLYAGNGHFSDPPVRFTDDEREVKYIVSTEYYVYRNYPRFVSGGGIMISRDLAQELVNKHDNNNYFKLDDVYIGMLALKLGVDAHHEKMFRAGVTDCECEPGLIVRHGAHDVDCMKKLQKCDPQVSKENDINRSRRVGRPSMIMNITFIISIMFIIIISFFRYLILGRWTLDSYVTYISNQ